MGNCPQDVTAPIERFARAFVRNPDGSWLCRARAHVVGPYGPMTTTPGTTYCKGVLVSGYDVASWLDDWHEGRRPALSIDFL
jgi:hypothetical protein